MAAIRLSLVRYRPMSMTDRKRSEKTPSPTRVASGWMLRCCTREMTNSSCFSKSTIQTEEEQSKRK